MLYWIFLFLKINIVYEKISEKICISENGFLLSVTYENCVTKLYTLTSFFPHKNIDSKESNNKEVRFKVIHNESSKIKGEKKIKKKNDATHAKVKLILQN